MGTVFVGLCTKQTRSSAQETAPRKSPARGVFPGFEPPPTAKPRTPVCVLPSISLVPCEVFLCSSILRFDGILCIFCPVSLEESGGTNEDHERRNAGVQIQGVCRTQRFGALVDFREESRYGWRGERLADYDRCALCNYLAGRKGVLQITAFACPLDESRRVGAGPAHTPGSGRGALARGLTGNHKGGTAESFAHILHQDVW
ncbi:unnamed protein product, partial [Hapterophycus canaliculatus]